MFTHASSRRQVNEHANGASPCNAAEQLSPMLSAKM